MSEDHISTVVIDPPVEYRTDDEIQQETEAQRQEPDAANREPPTPPYRSWLS